MLYGNERSISEYINNKLNLFVKFNFAQIDCFCFDMKQKKLYFSWITIS